MLGANDPTILDSDNAVHSQCRLQSFLYLFLSRHSVRTHSDAAPTNPCRITPALYAYRLKSLHLACELLLPAARRLAISSRLRVAEIHSLFEGEFRSKSNVDQSDKTCLVITITSHYAKSINKKSIKYRNVTLSSSAIELIGSKRASQ